MMGSSLKSLKIPVTLLLLLVWLASVPLAMVKSGHPPAPVLELGETIYRLQRLALTVQQEDSFPQQFGRALEAITVAAGLKTRFQSPDIIHGQVPINSVYLQSTSLNFEPLSVLQLVPGAPVRFQSFVSPPLLPPPRACMV